MNSRSNFPSPRRVRRGGGVRAFCATLPSARAPNPVFNPNWPPGAAGADHPCGGQRQDLRSIFQVRGAHLEDRHAGGFCLHRLLRLRSSNAITINHVGTSSAALGRELGIDEEAIIAVDGNGLARCVQGALVYELDVAAVEYPFARRLAGQRPSLAGDQPLDDREGYFRGSGGAPHE